MTTSSPIGGPVAANAEQVISVAADNALRGLIDTTWPEPHQLSSEAIIERVRSLRGGSLDQLRTGLQALANELELYRSGYDSGFEDGHTAGYAQAVDDAVTDPDAFTAKLIELRS